MKVKKTTLDGCLIIKPEVFKDKRGFFFETFQMKKYQLNANINESFVQDNFSSSKKNVLRGLHFQKKNPQGKLVRVSKGSVFDVAVDLRPNSKTFKNWYGLELSEDNKYQLWIPPSFAHGFVVTSDEADFEYKCTDYYDPDDEECIIWNDPDINIKWPISKPVLSSKDLDGKFFKEINF